MLSVALATTVGAATSQPPDPKAISLNYSVARAIPKAPERVLELIGNGFEIHDVCTSPFIEPELDVAEKYQRETVAALRKVTKPHLVESRDKCLAGVSVPLSPQ